MGSGACSKVGFRVHETLLLPSEALPDPGQLQAPPGESFGRVWRSSGTALGAPAGTLVGNPDFFRKNEAPAGMLAGNPDFSEGNKNLRAC